MVACGCVSLRASRHTSNFWLMVVFNLFPLPGALKTMKKVFTYKNPGNARFLMLCGAPGIR